LFHKQQIAVERELHLLIGTAIAGKVDCCGFASISECVSRQTADLGDSLEDIHLFTGGLLYRYCDRLAPFIFEYKELGVAIQQWILREDWYRFWGVQLWVFVILFVYVAAKETIEEIGGMRMRRLFFGF
jgi:hypothetical protein